eukprot:CAMPEP_0204567258 /NCGR_PEP_ID=MMETSP0661-20131031/36501_1 /ASSEMBLY_ACC=CAM_ASM_000606 /TAXON_ID=109239 /ORGANISM="Alexandrium margalefi, Strain AMGDE01CS-322" /LENGTH=69 /DNA_ID=CAMNT_0051575157 /DNA_START=17 /DNA_END=222 /DNA_ORIENTATION=-
MLRVPDVNSGSPQDLVPNGELVPGSGGPSRAPSALPVHTVRRERRTGKKGEGGNRRRAGGARTRALKHA